MDQWIKKQKNFGSLLFIIMLISAGCFEIVSVEQSKDIPSTGTFRAKIKIHIKCTEDLKNTHLVFAFLVPKEVLGANFAEVIYSSNVGNGIMQRIEKSHTSVAKDKSWTNFLLKRYQNGSNVFNDMTWIVFQTKEKFSVVKDQEDILGVISLSYNVGNNNLTFKPSYFIANTANGFDLNNSIYNGNLLTIKNGNGSTINYCQPQLTTIIPLKKNSLIITLNTNALANHLNTSQIIYFRSIAYTKSNKVIKRLNKEFYTKMTPAGNNKWRVIINLTNYFPIKTDDHIDRIVYSFVNNENKVLNGKSVGKLFIYKL